MFDKSHGLKTSKGQYSVIIIAPPFGNRICHALYNSNILCSICTKLHMFDKCAGLKTSACQHPVIVRAPPAGSRSLAHIMTLTYSSYIYHFKCILLTVRCFPEATVGGEPGCEVPFIAACSFNYYYFILLLQT